ncbi:transposase [Enterococcus faecium]|nr:transposase [Enterococcus faecium]
MLISCVLQEKLIWGSIHCHKYECPLFSLVKESFPNAQIIIDCFHIGQHLNKFFDRVRKRVMKQLNQKTLHKLSTIDN